MNDRWRLRARSHEGSGASKKPNASHAKSHAAYLRLAVMSALSFAAMYGLMYAMVDQWSNVKPNWNQAYMAGLMTAPMVIFELLLMRSMYESTRLNLTILIGGGGVLIALWLFIRGQVGIGDEQFLKSMIPHHAGAILMCQQASLTDPELEQLCANIVSSQQTEIDFMKAKLEDAWGE